MAEGALEPPCRSSSPLLRPIFVRATGTGPASRSGAAPALRDWNSAINQPPNYNEAYNGPARCDSVSSNHRCCAERRLLDTWIAAARRHGVPQHKVVPWVRRKLGTAVVVLRFRGDGRLGCSVPCVLCQRELQRFDLQVTCYLGDLAASGEPQWFSGRLSDVGAPSPVLTAGQRRTLNLEPMPGGVSARAVIAEPLPPAIKGGGGGGKKKSKSRKKRAPR